MGSVTVTVTEPPPQPPAQVTLEMDFDTARALKALTGVGLVHLHANADDVAHRGGFRGGMSEVMRKLVGAAVWDRLDKAGV